MEIATVYNLSLHCLQMSLLWDARHKWITFLFITTYKLSLGQLCIQLARFQLSSIRKSKKVTHLYSSTGKLTTKYTSMCVKYEDRNHD